MALSLTDMDIDVLTRECQDAFEECAFALQTLDSHWSKIEVFGRLLDAAKAKIPHGGWEDWVTDTFQGRLPMRTAQRWIAGAKDKKNPKAPEVAHLNSDTSEQQSQASVEVIDPAYQPFSDKKDKKKGDGKPKSKPVTAELVGKPFHPGERLHTDKESILAIAGDWMAEKKLPMFCDLLRDILSQLE